MLRAGTFAVVLVGLGCSAKPPAPATPARSIVVEEETPIEPTSTPSAEVEADALYFAVDGDSIRLTKSAVDVTPEVAAALAPTEIAEARESAEIKSPHGTSHHVHLSTAGDMDVAALAPSRARNTAIGGIMFDSTHIDLTFAGEDAVVSVATALWEPCGGEIEGIDLPSSLRSAERLLTRDFETRAFSFDDAAAVEIALRWAGEQGHPVLTQPPEAKLEPTAPTWEITVLDLRPRGVLVHCARRHAS